MYAVKNNDGYYYSVVRSSKWDKSLRVAKMYDLNGAKKSAERHNGKVVEVGMRPFGDGYSFYEINIS